MSDEDAARRRLLGYACPKAPDGPLIPPACLYDPCGHDVAVYSDGTTDPPNFGQSGRTVTDTQ